MYMCVLSGVGAYFARECEKRGMLVRVAGDTIMMSPPFIISHQEVEEVQCYSVLFMITPRFLSTY